MTMANSYYPRSQSKGDVALPPKQPYNCYAIFFRIERAYILQSSGIIDEEVASSLVLNHHDPLEFPRPAKYQNLVLPPYWYSRSQSAAVAKKRRHRKREGRLDLQTLSKTISATWKNADQTLIQYCNKLAHDELSKFNTTIFNKHTVATFSSATYQKVCTPNNEDGVLNSRAGPKRHQEEIERGAKEQTPEEIWARRETKENVQKLIYKDGHFISLGGSKKYREESEGLMREQLFARTNLSSSLPDPRPMGWMKTHQLKVDGASIGIQDHLLNRGLCRGVQAGTCFSVGSSQQLANRLFAASAAAMSSSQNSQNKRAKNSTFPWDWHQPVLPVLAPGGPHSLYIGGTKQAAHDSMLLAAQPSVPHQTAQFNQESMILGIGLSNSKPNMDTRIVTMPNDNKHKLHFIPSPVTSCDVQDQNICASTSSGDWVQPTQPEYDNAICLFIPSDDRVLDPVHNFPRCHCIQLFEKKINDHNQGEDGQVGLRCFYCNEICFPSKLEAIYANVMNFQQNHMEICPKFPAKVKAKYKALIQVEYWSQKKRLAPEFFKAYYAEAASEIGLVDSPHGVIFGTPPNKSGIPSKRLQALIDASELHQVS